MSELINRTELWNINGVDIELGKLTCNQLLEMEASAHNRRIEATVDQEILRDVRERLYPPDEAA